VTILQPQYGVLQCQGSTFTFTEIGVDTVCVGLVIGAFTVRQSLNLLFSNPVPIQSTQELIGIQLRGAEQFREPSAGHMTTEVHFPKTVLGVHETLGEEQVV